MIEFTYYNTEEYTAVIIMVAIMILVIISNYIYERFRTLKCNLRDADRFMASKDNIIEYRDSAIEDLKKEIKDKNNENTALRYEINFLKQEIDKKEPEEYTKTIDTFKKEKEDAIAELDEYKRNFKALKKICGILIKTESEEKGLDVDTLMGKMEEYDLKKKRIEDIKNAKQLYIYEGGYGGREFSDIEYISFENEYMFIKYKDCNQDTIAKIKLDKMEVIRIKN